MAGDPGEMMHALAGPGVSIVSLVGVDSSPGFSSVGGGGEVKKNRGLHASIAAIRVRKIITR